MTGKRPTRTRLAEADQAMHGLLETLLAEVPAGAADPESAARVVPAAPGGDQEAAADPPFGKPQAQLNIAPAMPLQDAVPAVDDATPPPPGWGRAAFKVLPFVGNGVRLAVPLVKLTAIARLDTAGTRLPGQQAWHLGVMPYRDGRLVQVDLGALLGFGGEPPRAGYLLVIADGQFGLVCERLEDLLDQDPDKVRWRQQGERRDWAAGMLPDEMCTLLDVDAVEAHLGGGGTRTQSGIAPGVRSGGEFHGRRDNE